MLDRLRRRMAQVLETPAPVIFVLAAIAVTLIAESAIKTVEGLVEGSSLWTALWLFVGGAVLLLVLLVGFNLLGRLRQLTTPRIKPQPFPTKENASELGDFVRHRPGLIVLVSDGMHPVAQHAINHHGYQVGGTQPVLECCWLIAGPLGDRTPTSLDNAKRLQHDLAERDIDAIILQLTMSTDAGESYRLTQQALDAAREKYAPEQLVVDCTGGTKLMTLGMALAAVDYGVELEFFDARQLNAQGKPEKMAGGVARPVSLRNENS